MDLPPTLVQLLGNSPGLGLPHTIQKGGPPAAPPPEAHLWPKRLAPISTPRQLKSWTNDAGPPPHPRKLLVLKRRPWSHREPAQEVTRRVGNPQQGVVNAVVKRNRKCSAGDFDRLRLDLVAPQFGCSGPHRLIATYRRRLSSFGVDPNAVAARPSACPSPGHQCGCRGVARVARAAPNK